MFTSPEALFLATEWRRMLAGDLYRKNFVGFIIGEAHCVKKWNVYTLYTHVIIKLLSVHIHVPP